MVQKQAWSIKNYRYVGDVSAASSDHGPILLRWHQRVDPRARRNERGNFRYELMWETHTNFPPVMQ
jgi:hypothetical protein